MNKGSTARKGRSTWRNTLALLMVTGATLLSVASAPTPAAEGWTYATDFPLEVGFGWEPWVAYESYGELPLERGFQGGQHLNASLRTFFLEPQEGQYLCSLSVVLASDPDGQPLAESTDVCDVGTPGQLEVPTPAGLEEGSLIAPWLRLIVDDDNHTGELVELRVQVEAPDGQIGRALVEAPLTWMANCSEVPEDYPLPCSF
jgi:hypothetical protein